MYHTYVNCVQNAQLLAQGTALDFIAADWNDLRDGKYFTSFALTPEQRLANTSAYAVTPGGYDFIFGADVLYEVENYATLLDLFDKLLSPTGCAVIVTKLYYYGNGGSLYEFQDAVDKGGRFGHATLKTINDNSSNRREVLLLRRLA